MVEYSCHDFRRHDNKPLVVQDAAVPGRPMVFVPTVDATVDADCVELDQIGVRNRPLLAKYGSKLRHDVFHELHFAVGQFTVVVLGDVLQRSAFARAEGMSSCELGALPRVL